MNLKNTVLNYYEEIELTDISLNIVDLVIENENEMVGYLTISGYDHLESIEIKGNSLHNILTLTIDNNPMLRSIIIGEHANKNTMNITLSSNNYIYYRRVVILFNNFIDFDWFD